MAPAIYEDLTNSTEDWFCPSSFQTKHASTTGCGQDQCSTSGDSDDESNTTLGSEVTDTKPSIPPTSP
jgi:hypothetical protein